MWQKLLFWLLDPQYAKLWLKYEVSYMNIMKTLITWIFPLVLHTLSMEPFFKNQLNEKFQSSVNTKTLFFFFFFFSLGLVLIVVNKQTHIFPLAPMTKKFYNYKKDQKIYRQRTSFGKFNATNASISALMIIQCWERPQKNW